ncbi:MAG: STAS domain-containing protein [Bacillota bacterium]
MEVEKKTDQEAVIYLGEKVNIVNSPELKQKLQALYDEGYKTIIVDFSGTKMIDSSCLGKLLMFQKKLKEREGELKIVNVSSEYINKMFNVIQLYKVINIS